MLLSPLFKPNFSCFDAIFREIILVFSEINVIEMFFFFFFFEKFTSR